jgi:hypothetical protein
MGEFLVDYLVPILLAVFGAVIVLAAAAIWRINNRD